MGEPTPAPPRLLTYRPWRGELGGPFPAVLAIARTSLAMLFRRRLFWGLYALGLLVFLFFFFAQYFLFWIESQVGQDRVRLGSGLQAVTVEPARLSGILRDRLKLNGSGETYRAFVSYEGSVVMVVLALAGAVLVGNDFRFGSLPFYLSKPMSRWHYIAGKCLAVAAFVNLLTTIPAVVLFVQYGLLDDWSYFADNARLLLGILGYGLVLTVVFSLLLVATAAALRRTVPLVMVWTSVFVFGQAAAGFLVDVLRLNPRWRLIDLWNDAYLVGSWMLGLAPETIRQQPQPTSAEAAVVLALVCLCCLVSLHRRIRAVEVVA